MELHLKIGKLMHRKYLLGNWTYNNETSTFMTEIECSSKWHIFITTCPHPILLAIQIKRVWIELLTQKSLSINMISTWSGEINPTSRNEKYSIAWSPSGRLWFLQTRGSLISSQGAKPRGMKYDSQGLAKPICLPIGDHATVLLFKVT